MCGNKPTREELEGCWSLDENEFIKKLEWRKQKGMILSYRKKPGPQPQRCVHYLNEVYDDSQLHADHITPIALGGDEWDMNNIQTLCEECHKKKTAKDAAKISQRRRVEELQQKGQTQLTR